MGYHCHLLKRHSGVYEESGHLFTRKGSTIYAEEHGRGGRPLIDLKRRRRAVLNEIQ